MLRRAPCRHFRDSVPAGEMVCVCVQAQAGGGAARAAEDSPTATPCLSFLYSRQAPTAHLAALS